MAMKIPSNLISTIEDGESGGSGPEETQEFNLGVPDDYGQEQQESNDSGTEQPEVKDNPAWKEVYDLLPAEFHPMIQPKLKSWDDNFAKVQSQYAPYKPLVERGVPFDAIQTSMDFANLVNSNPRAVWDELGKRYGFSGQGQQQVEEENTEEQEEENGLFEPQDLSKNPQFAQLQQSYQQLVERLAQEEQAKQAWVEEQQARSEIDTEWQTIEAKTGKLPEEVKAEIVRRSIFIGDSRGDGNYSLAEGYADYANFVSRVRNTRANNTAPDVMPGNGGLPKAKKSYGEMNEDEFVDSIAQMAKALAEGNK
jgi:hypothetical protein